MGWLAFFIVAVLAGYGMAVALVEKRKQWPIRKVNVLLRIYLGKIHRPLRGMLKCTVCCSMWTTLFADLGMMCYSKFTYIPLWPLSGFIALGLTWTVIELMNAIDPK